MAGFGAIDANLYFIILLLREMSNRGCRRWMLAARGRIVRILHQRQDCLRALFLDECQSGVSLTLRETPQLIEKVHQSVVFSADERV